MKIRMMSALLVIVTVFTMFTGISIQTHAAISGLKISIEAQNVQQGNSYYEGDVPAFSLMLENKYSSPRETTLVYDVKDDKGVSVYGDVRTISLAGKQTVLIGFIPDIEGRFGVYDITANLSSGVEKAEATFKFSYSRKVTAHLEDLGVMCHFSKIGKSGGNYAYIGDSNHILEESGMGWIRDEINWSNVETENGKYSIPQRYDDSVNGAIASGKKVLLIITGGNMLYESGKGPNGEPTNCLPLTQAGIDGFTNFAKYVAEYFKGRVDTFEIWNEPDWIVFNGHYNWLPADKTIYWTQLAEKSSAAYGNLIKSVYPAIKSVYPGEEDKVTVVSGGCMPVKSDRGYLSRLLSINGIENYIDAVAVHPYSDNATYGDMVSGSDYDLPTQIERVKSYTDKPIYLTEYGASSYAENNGNDGASSFKGYGVLGVRGQAVALVRAYMLVVSDPQIENVFFYNFKEKSATPGIEANFGIIDFDYTPKSSYVAISNMADLLGNAEPIKMIDANPTNYAWGDRARFYEFADKINGDEIFVVEAGGSQFEWTTKLIVTNDADPLRGDATAVLDNTNKTVTINGYKGGKVKVLDIMGNEIEPTNGQYPIYLEPMYVICSKTDKTEIINGDTVYVNGVGAKANSFVSAVVYKKNAIGQKIAFMEQTMSDKNGRYSFSFEKNKGDIYEIRIYNGFALENKGLGTENYDFDIKYYVNDVELSDLSSVKAGDNLKLEMEITDKQALGAELMVYGAVYDNDSVVFASDSDLSEWSEGKTVLTAEVNIPENFSAEALKFMLWDMNMNPVVNKIQG